MKNQNNPILNSPVIGYAHHRIILDDSGLPVDFEFLEVNQTFEKLTGLNSENLIGSNARQVMPGIEKSEFDWVGYYGDIALYGGEKEFEKYSEHLDKWYRVHVYSTEKFKFTTMFMDITESKNAETLLAENEDRFSRALAGTGAGLWDWDMEKNSVYFSQQWKKMLGYEDHEIENSFDGWKNLWHPDDINRIKKGINDYLEGKTKVYEVENRLLHKDGSWRWILTRGEIERDSTGKPVRWTGTNIDITDRKQMEQELLQERDLFTAGPVFTVEWEPSENWPIRSISVNVKEILGYSAEEMKSPSIKYSELIHPDDIEHILPEVTYNITNHIDAFEQSYRIRCKDGEYRWFYDFTKLVRNEKGELISIRGYLYDQTLQKEAEFALHQERLRLQGILEGTHVGTWEWNVQTGDTVFNERWAEMVGFSLEELMPVSIETWMNFAHPDDLKGSEEALNRHFNQETDFYEYESRMKHKDGHWIWVLDKGKVISRTDDGKPLMMMGTHQDITDRKKRETELQTILETTLDGFFIASAEGEIETVNSAMEKMLGYTRDELLAMSIADIEALESPEDTAMHIQRVFHQGYDRFESRHLRRDGSVCDVAVSVTLLEVDVPKLVVFVTDISEQKAVEREREYNTTLLSELFEQSPVGIALNDFDTGAFLEVNSKLLEPTGYTKEEFLALSYWDVTPKEYAPQEEIALAQMKEYGYFESFEKEYIRKDGSRYPVRLKGIVVTDINEKKRIWVIVEDISLEREASRKLRENEEKFRTLFETVPVGITIASKDGTINESNSAAEKILGLSQEHQFQREIDGSEWQIIRKDGSFMPPEEYASVRAMKDGITVYGEEMGVVRGKDDIAWIIVNAAPVEGLGVVISYVDITDKKNAEEELRKTNLYLEEATAYAKSLAADAQMANQAKSEFLANMSHEIRTPMNAVLGLGRLLEDTPVNAQQRDYLKKINRSSKFLLGVINDILDFSKIDSGSLELDLEPFELKDVLDQTRMLFVSSAQEKELEIIFDASPDLPRVLFGDPLRLGQVLTNLVGNAVKFTEKGHVTLHISRADKNNVSKDFCSLWFCVEDSGIGMTAKQIDRLFKPFSQADSSTTRKYGGTGLGLVISHRLVEAMGGSLEVSSVPGKGSSFFFTLDMRVASSAVGLVDSPENMTSGMSFLVVDDQKMPRMVLRRILESWNARVIEASSGTQAVSKIVEAQKREKYFDYILMDWKMPGQIDGLGAISQIQKLYENGTLKGSQPPVFMISAYDKEELPKDETVIYSAFLEKPVTASELFDAMMEASGGKLIYDNHQSSLEIPSFAGYTVLLVEDNELNQEVAISFIEKTGAEVLVAENGKYALNLLEKKGVDLVFMDLQMPVMDGFAATAEIRRKESESGKKMHLPVIALSAAVMEADRTKALNAGMDELLAKPIDENDLYRIMGNYLENQGVILQEDQLALQAKDSDKEFPELDGFDLKQARATSRGNPDFYLKLLRRFYSQLSGDFTNLQERIYTLSFDKIQHELHTLKGTAATVGAMRIAEIASDIDRLSRQKTMPADSMINELSEAISDACKQIAMHLHSEKEVNTVDEKEGRSALNSIVAKLRNNELIEDNLLDTAADYIGTRIGIEQARKLRIMVEQFDMDGAVDFLGELFKDISKDGEL
ncbi:MAG: PAS domain S-box protein [Thermodesulfobacteriota bacterium]